MIPTMNEYAAYDRDTLRSVMIGETLPTLLAGLHHMDVDYPLGFLIEDRTDAAAPLRVLTRVPRSAVDLLALYTLPVDAISEHRSVLRPSIRTTIAGERLGTGKHWVFLRRRKWYEAALAHLNERADRLLSSLSSWEVVSDAAGVLGAVVE